MGADISSYPEIALSGATFYTPDRQPADFLRLLKDAGVNTIRLRLWVQPQTEHSSLEEVKAFSEQLRAMGFRIWLTLHYSDTWADPQQQITPARWQGLAFSALKDSVWTYTKSIVEQIRPEYIQIGNEINRGFLHPTGDIAHLQQLRTLLQAGIQATRAHSPTSRIILHYAGIENARQFYRQMEGLDYDLMALSYYPIWHGKNLMALKNTLELLHREFHKEILIAETAYPFTLSWNDWTTNIVGLEEHLILPDFPATPQGQRDFIARIRDIVRDIGGGRGLCYWGGELIAWKGPMATDGSPWENQALFDFQHGALPVLQAFRPE